MGRVKDYYWDIITSPDWLERQTLSQQDISDCCEAEERISYHELEAATMAKVTEGKHYYYAPVPADANPLFYIPNTFEIWKVGDFSPMAANLKQDDASLIVDALNEYQDMRTEKLVWYRWNDGTKKSTI